MYKDRYFSIEDKIQDGVSLVLDEVIAWGESVCKREKISPIPSEKKFRSYDGISEITILWEAADLIASFIGESVAFKAGVLETREGMAGAFVNDHDFQKCVTDVLFGTLEREEKTPPIANRLYDIMSGADKRYKITRELLRDTLLWFDSEEDRDDGRNFYLQPVSLNFMLANHEVFFIAVPRKKKKNPQLSALFKLRPVIDSAVEAIVREGADPFLACKELLLRTLGVILPPNDNSQCQARLTTVLQLIGQASRVYPVTKKNCNLFLGAQDCRLSGIGRGVFSQNRLSCRVCDPN